ncbi:MAG: protein SanA [Bacteroidota bacterium]|nr:protein SanA [Bacteroidota bacterium]
MKKLFSKKLFLRLYLPIIILFIAFIFYCSYAVEKNAEGKTYNNISDVPYHHVGLLLGTCKTTHDRKTINPFWKYRLEAAYELWKAKKIDKILISGDIGWHGYNELQDFYEAFIALGVPDSALVCDFTGFRTHDSVIRCKKVFGQKSVTIISQKFHNERALFIAKYYGLDAVGYNAKDVTFKEGLYNVVREKLARLLMFGDLYVFHTKPHLLGRKIIIK